MAISSSPFSIECSHNQGVVKWRAGNESFSEAAQSEEVATLFVDLSKV